MNQWKNDGDWIRITDGAYKGTLFKFGDIKLLPIEDDQFDLSFDFEVKDDKKDYDNVIFKSLLSDIIIELIERSLCENRD